ncbi:hypothetical protein HMPREF9004_1436 [Schaalia cardiffensis F0333]|uniref:Uncharacterized protein n=1 Tax=Schaalia cardiffensis F0333 TaxID=888050 RepID=N6X150_9ACTO|nr:hypothetical protein HMPREF9004_1436 [Schaalia cardiffensis F0333]
MGAKRHAAWPPSCCSVKLEQVDYRLSFTPRLSTEESGTLWPL